MTTPKKKIPLPPLIHIGNVNPSECDCIENVNIKGLLKTLKKNENGEFVLTKWINAEYSSKRKYNGWHPYITSLCNGEKMDDAIARIKSENPQFNFRNFHEEPAIQLSGKKVVAVLDSYMQRKPLPSLKNSLIDNEK